MEKIGLDKCLHVVVCFVITAFAALLCYGVFGQPHAVSAAIGAIAAFCVGVAKECYDFFKGGKFDVKDILADVIGIAAGFGIAFLM